MTKEINQLYVVTKAWGPLFIGQHIVTFKDGSAHVVEDGILEDKKTFKAKPGPPVHLYEYINNIEPIGLNETGLILALECPQCGNGNITIMNLSSGVEDVRAVKCGNCPLSVEDPNIDINKLITIWNNIKR